MRDILPITNAKILSKVNFTNICNIPNTTIYPPLISTLTVFTLLFLLEKNEINKFNNDIKIGGNKDVTIRIKFGENVVGEIVKKRDENGED